jgi:hypothetical protein
MNRTNLNFVLNELGQKPGLYSQNTYKLLTINILDEVKKSFGVNLVEIRHPCLKSDR